MPRMPTLPLSAAQQRLWFLEELSPGSTEYNTGIGLRMSGELDIGALRAALDDLANRHESLRTTFDTVDGRGVQVVAAEGDIPLRIVDMSAIEPDQRDAAVEQALDTSGATSIIHLAALQVPFCKADPVLGAQVNVVGTVNVFEAVKRRRERISREELLRLWEGRARSVVYVTHDIEEAVLLADRVAVIGGRPARILGEIDIPLARPRTKVMRRGPAFYDLVEDVRTLLA